MIVEIYTQHRKKYGILVKGMLLLVCENKEIAKKKFDEIKQRRWLQCGWCG